MNIQPDLQISWDAQTDPGTVRKNNEDAFVALALNTNEFYYLGKSGSAPLEDGNDYIFAVADGMGGEKSGEYASRIAVEKITRILPPYLKKRKNGTIEGYQDAFQKVFEETHRALTYLGHSYDECSNMGSTLSLVWFTGFQTLFSHIGDSRIYYLHSNGKLDQISHDHTYVGFQFRSGQLSEREARLHPRKNALQRALGAGQQIINPQIDSLPFHPDDSFLLCSDGLVDGLWDKHILRLLNHPTQEEQSLSPAKRLVHSAVQNSGQDNTTAIHIHISPRP